MIDVHGVRAVREACGNQRALEPAQIADANLAAFELGPVAARRRKHFLPHRIEHDSVFESALDLASDRYGERGEAVQEVCRAIERVDDPHDITFAGATAFLGEKCMVRIQPANRPDDLFLGGTIDVGDIIVTTFGRHIEAIEPRQAADDDITRATCGADGKTE